MIIEALFLKQKVTIQDDKVDCKNQDIKEIFKFWMTKDMGTGPEDGYLSNMIKLFGKNLQIISITEDENIIY